MESDPWRHGQWITGTGFLVLDYWYLISVLDYWYWIIVLDYWYWIIVLDHWYWITGTG
jgi:hypothetical protein